MKKLRRWTAVSLVLAFASLISLLLEYLALADIAKGGQALLEWRIVGICMLITLGFIISSFITFMIVLRLPTIWSETETKIRETS